MKRTLPLLAVLAATLAAPVAAQDISSILNPGNFAARLGPNGSAAMANLPRDMSGLFQMPNAAVRMNPSMANQIAALAPAAEVHTSPLAPRTSLAPIPRGTIARILAPAAVAAPVAVPAAQGTDLITAMTVVADAAPAGANTVVINGSNTAVISSSPTVAAVPSRSLWQRLFGG